MESLRIFWQNVINTTQASSCYVLGEADGTAVRSVTDTQGARDELLHSSATHPLTYAVWVLTVVCLSVKLATEVRCICALDKQDKREDGRAEEQEGTSKEESTLQRASHSRARSSSYLGLHLLHSRFLRSRGLFLFTRQVNEAPRD